jgi:hypothetical protein
VRIPLDYYRILGLPILATADQVKQSHRDRTLQLPRPDFSTQAIAARKALLDQAYELLSDDERRRDYDARFLASTHEPSPDSAPAPTQASPHSDIEVEESQLIGALLLLQELGEYESVLRLGRKYLNPSNTAIRDGHLGESKAALSDVVLAIALACLELGREEWQQGGYDNAAEALETGQELLLREGLFPAVRAEVQGDLFKLRPYRILAMLSDADEETPRRQQGLVMLREMLNDRQGIDGNGIDQSGLGVDDFLRFIQQLRDYMTVDEQQALFESEARRPSAVATYLAVYTLMAKGFARQEPALIRRAKGLLSRLGTRQDVYLEQSICSLLLGQPEAAAKALERSQEYEPLAFIREHSQGSSDLLPGLCLYTERWMQEEVFPHFRDLATQTASLKDYFANPQVQAYLEELPLSGPEPTQQGQWMSNSGPAAPMPAGLKDDRSQWRSTGRGNDLSADDIDGFNPAARTGAVVGGAAALAGTTAMGWAVTHQGGEGNADNNGAVPVAPDHPPTKPSNKRKVRQRSMQPTVPLDRNDDEAGAIAPNGGTVDRDRASGGCFPMVLGLLLTGLLGFMLVNVLRGFNRPASTPIAATPIPTALPSVTPSPVGIQGEMNATTAKQVLELWFSTKKAAMGAGHASDKLEAVLTGDKLAEWRKESIEAKAENLTIEYEHSADVSSATVNPTNPNEATVSATVTERRKYIREGTPFDESNDEGMGLNYTFVRENNQWKIKSW